ncbi:MAG TPA: DNA polymerase III subunit gamma/tau [Pirellulales bacterium]|nr:DNA polymerase III subunit gamma/tau [Pirellulales bacterium]
MASDGLPGLSDDASPSGGVHREGGKKEYVVVARRYRPQTFAELVGQEHVARALTAAITSNRVGHAYLFTGARGVGKTSAARILAKCLNCQEGPAPVPCDRCDSCLSIAAGDDVDVLEIDGASNRGIEEMRELRHNVAIRPSRSRFKIYIIDEVHMLTREAFNALLKTLEEPPEHVKFIFCTTEAEKIPVTILSRCQRFDFAGIQAGSIVDRLRQIVAAEGVEADPQALVLLSRRAGGSMRDSQSLLEQLLAVGGREITVDDVNHLLGTASDERLSRMAGHLVARDAAAAIAELDAAASSGVDSGQLLDQLLVYFRDLMVAAVGGSGEILLQSDPALQKLAAEQAQQLGLQTVLAAMQVLDHTLARLRYSTQGRVLAELALVRICQLADLEELPALIQQIKSGTDVTPSNDAVSRPVVQRAPAPAAQPVRQVSSSTTAAARPASRAEPSESATQNEVKKNGEVASVNLSDETPAPTLNSSQPSSLQPADAPRLWQQTLARLQGMAADYANQAGHVAISAPNLLVVTFAKKYNLAKAFCEKTDQLEKIERALAEVAGQPMRVSFVLEQSAGPTTTTAARPPQGRDRVREKAKHPMVSRAIELFEARPLRVDDRNV